MFQNSTDPKSYAVRSFLWLNIENLVPYLFGMGGEEK